MIPEDSLRNEEGITMGTEILAQAHQDREKISNKTSTWSKGRQMDKLQRFFIVTAQARALKNLTLVTLL